MSLHVSSSLLGDATPNDPVFCLKTGGIISHDQFYKQQGRRGRGRGKVKTSTKATVHTEVDNEIHLKQRQTLAMYSREDIANKVSSLDSVGCQTSILLKKAKNEAKLPKSMQFSLMKRVSADQSSEKLHQPTILCTPPTPKSSKENGMEVFFLLFNDSGHCWLLVRIVQCRSLNYLKSSFFF